MDGENPEKQRHPSRLKAVLSFKKTAIFIITPILLAPLPFHIPEQEALAAYVALILAVYWIFEVVPLAVTALLPIILFPLLGILDSKTTCSNYFKDTNVLFVGGLIVAVAVERWNLHKRIALRVLLLVGSKPKWIMFGFMVTTAFLSMWISNTATTAMMVPVAKAVVTQLCDHDDKTNKSAKATATRKASSDPKARWPQEVSAGNMEERNPMIQNGDVEMETKFDEVEMNEIQVMPPGGEAGGLAEVTENYTGEDDANDLHKQETKKRDENLQKGIFLCVAYAANIGGTGTLTGTNPNLVLAGQVESLYGREAGVNFGTWFGYAFPGMVITLFTCWFLLDFMYLDLKNDITSCFKGICGSRERLEKDDCKDKSESVKRIFREQYDELGPTSWAEIAVSCHFGILALLWLTRDPGFVPGWGQYFEEGYVTDATAAMMVAVSLFVFPSRKPNIFCCRDGAGSVPAILDWKSVNDTLPWSVVILLGGSFALADGIKTSGLTDWIGEQMTSLASIPPIAVAMAGVLVVAIFTEITSNTATATIFLPVLGKLGEAVRVNPLYLMLPACLTCSFAFMLPIATPPNAIAFSYGVLSVMDMVKAGTPMTIIAIFLALLNTNIMGVALFDVTTYPDWADSSVAATAPSNVTGVPCVTNMLPTVLVSNV
ncbi:Na(+)/citrate cotransporter-like [Ptychodera flava]|uniref:Na(+)/citrate cotransporter-like n=1 Tax=Ptychodera flava TaxID=63121 RepID=UPI003969F0CA